jgi:hypothetical protein
VNDRDHAGYARNLRRLHTKYGVFWQIGRSMQVYGARILVTMWPASTIFLRNF